MGYKQIFKNENTHADAQGNFSLVIKGAEVCDSLEEATEDFLDILDDVGGEQKTSEARDVFRDIYGL